jgi:hypothetical protein
MPSIAVKIYSYRKALSLCFWGVTESLFAAIRVQKKKENIIVVYICNSISTL